MTSDIQLLLIGTLIGFIVTILTTIITHHLQNLRDEKERKWRAEQEITNKWWNRQADAYGNIINELTNMAYSLENWLNIEFQISEGSTDLTFDRFLEDYKTALVSIEKTELGGAYLISKKSVDALKKLIITLDINDEDFEVDSLKKLDSLYLSTKECLEIIRDEAQISLRINIIN